MLYRQFATQDDIDAQYDLSKVIGDPSDYFQFYASESASARSDLNCVLDVRFGPTLEENLDIFPAQQRDAPILFFIHGGYWRALDKSAMMHHMADLLGAGFGIVNGSELLIDNQVITNAGNILDVTVTIEEAL